MNTPNIPIRDAKMEVFFDLSDDDVYVSFQKHLDSNPGFQQMIHKESNIEGRKKEIRVDIRSPFHSNALNKTHIRRVLRNL